MRILISFLFSLILLSCGHTETSNEHKFKSTFLNREGLPIVEFKTASNEKINFIIDTGSELNLINEDYFNSNKNIFIVVDSMRSNITTVNGKIQKQTYLVQMTLDDSVFIKLKVLDINNVIDNIFNSQYVAVQGIIGVPFLYENKMMVDFKNKTLYHM